MGGVHALSLLLWPLALAHALEEPWDCSVSRSDVRQVDAGNGQVVAVGSNQQVYTLSGSGWSELGTQELERVTVGAAGVWGTDESKRVYKYLSGDFERAPGVSLSQVDAGGGGQVVGIRLGFFGFNSVACLKESSSSSFVGNASLEWTTDSALMKYISCGPRLGCWGINKDLDAHFTGSISPTTCQSQGWSRVQGPKMEMIEVGRDGEVFGLSEGNVFRRTGISFFNRGGTSWKRVQFNTSEVIRHLSYDQDQLWVVTADNLLLRCSAVQSSCCVSMVIIGSLIVSLLFS